MTMNIRKFNDLGHKEFLIFYANLKEAINLENGNTKQKISKALKKQKLDKVKEIISSNKYSYEIDSKIKIENKIFTNKLEYGIYIDKILKNIPEYELNKDYFLWDWLSAFYFEQLFTEEMSGYDDARYILSFDWRLKTRHLTYTPWWVVRNYGHENSRIFLKKNKVFIGGDWNEQYLKKNHIRNYKKIAELCHLLYYDEEKEQDIPGSSKHNDGAVNDLGEEIKYLNLINDLLAMPLENILEKLPDRFFNYIRKIDKKIILNGKTFS